jgi:outer membrane protein assembly complex protein YaeT
MDLLRRAPISRPARIAFTLLALSAAACAQAPPPQERVRLRFEGAEVLSEDRLREEVARQADLYAEEQDLTFLDDAAFKIRRLYQETGHPFVQVRFAADPAQVTFSVREGPRVLFGRVRVVGNRELPDEVLLPSISGGLLASAPPFTHRLLSTVQNAVLSTYGVHGFVEARISATTFDYDDEDRRMNVTLSVNEGPRIFLTRFVGAPDDGGVGKALGAMLGKPYTPGTASAVERIVLDDLAENGHPLGRVTVRADLDRERGSAVLHLEIHRGPEVRIGPVRVRGNTHTREGHVRAVADVREGRLYRQSEIRKAERRLMDTRMFHSVRAVLGSVQDESGLAPLTIQVDERDRIDLAVMGGYGTLEGVRGGAELTVQNSLGVGEVARVRGTGGRFGYRADAEFSLPYFLGGDSRPGLSGYYENREYPSFEAASFGGAASAVYPLHEKVTGTGALRHAEVRTREIFTEVFAEELLDFSYSALFLSVRWDRRDNPVLPTRGLFVTGSVEWTPASLSQDIQFVNLFSRVSYCVPLPAGTVLATSLQGGLILPIGATQEIPISLRYFAGGTGTVRGFEFASIGPQSNGEATGGEVLLALQTELRVPVWGNLYGAVFTDQGGIWLHHGDVDLGDLRYSVGAGLRFYTPAGPVVLDVGFNPDRREGEPASEIHISIGFPF